MHGLILRLVIVKVVIFFFFFFPIHVFYLYNLLQKYGIMISGMSDLLSPFVVLFENNADAFWCFEMLLRRMVLE